MEKGSEGVAAGVELVSIKVLNEYGETTVSDMIDALDYVGRKASSDDVVNISISGPMSPGLDKAIQDCPGPEWCYHSLSLLEITAMTFSITARLVFRIQIKFIRYLLLGLGILFSSFANYGLQGGFVAPGEHVFFHFPATIPMLYSAELLWRPPHAAGVLLITQQPKISGFFYGFKATCRLLRLYRISRR